MGKITTNPKSIESRERKAENAAAKKAAILKAKEDASWEDNDKQLARKADRANAAVSFSSNSNENFVQGSALRFKNQSRGHYNLYIQAEKREGELARKKANQELYEAEMAAAASSKGIMGP